MKAKDPEVMTKKEKAEYILSAIYGTKIACEAKNVTGALKQVMLFKSFCDVYRSIFKSEPQLQCRVNFSNTDTQYGFIQSNEYISFIS
jgi:hypothetical protein